MVESYVIQIYRRGDSGRELTGTIEPVGHGTRSPFSTVEELWACLVAAQPRRRASRTPARAEPPGSKRVKG